MENIKVVVVIISSFSEAHDSVVICCWPLIYFCLPIWVTILPLWFHKDLDITDLCWYCVYKLTELLVTCASVDSNVFCHNLSLESLENGFLMGHWMKNRREIFRVFTKCLIGKQFDFDKTQATHISMLFINRIKCGV